MATTTEKTEKKRPITEEKFESLVRILSYDIPGSKNLYTGLTKVKGISWSISNIICRKLGIPKETKMSDLSKKQIEDIENAIEDLETLDFLKNRRNDFDTGKNIHLVGTDVDIRREFDIKRMKQIKSYRGIRHSMKQPVRGQRTRSHFRTTGVAVGVKKPKTGKKG